MVRSVITYGQYYSYLSQIVSYKLASHPGSLSSLPAQSVSSKLA